MKKIKKVSKKFKVKKLEKEVVLKAVDTTHNHADVRIIPFPQIFENQEGKLIKEI